MSGSRSDKRLLRTVRKWDTVTNGAPAAKPLVPAAPRQQVVWATLLCDGLAALSVVNHSVRMARRRIYDDDLYAHFVTFSCFHRRRHLDTDQAKRIVLAELNTQLRVQHAKCIGFVVMPDHVHSIVWFPKPNQLSHFMKQWKQQSSIKIKEFIQQKLPSFAATFDESNPCWQPRYYPFHIYSQEKLIEKLGYMHMNPVRAGLVERAIDWPWSSARWYECGTSVGVPLSWIE
jgi:putative transposase